MSKLTTDELEVVDEMEQGIEDEEVLLKGFTEGVARAAGQVAEPFVSESMFT